MAPTSTTEVPTIERLLVGLCATLNAASFDSQVNPTQPGVALRKMHCD